MNRAIDVSGLPATTFGPRDLMWWGTTCFMLIEGTTLFACAASYLYLWVNSGSWPPGSTPRPSLLWPSVQAGLMLLSVWPAYAADRAARRFDLGAVRRWMLLISVLGVIFVALRCLEFRALHVRWDTNAYASIAWLTLGFHGTILLLQAIESIIFTIFLFGERIEEKHFSDVTDSSFYWYFMTGSWVVLYLLVFLAPGLQ